MQPGDRVAERFLIERLAGSGGMGAVYRALDQQSGEHVALKVLWGIRPDDARRFAREAAMLAEFHEPSIGRYVAHGSAAAGEPYLAMEWIDGESLEARMARAPLTVAESLKLATAVARAIAVLHRSGVVHRDVKPGNLMLPNGSLDQVKLLDLGIARRLSGHAALTQTGAVLGSVHYMSPEQARAEREIDARSDVFSLGCVLFECLAGRTPFTGDMVYAILMKIVLEVAPALSDIDVHVPEALEALVAKMLARAPEQRFADGAAALAALEALAPLEEAVPSSGPVSLSSGRRRALTSNERRVFALLVARPDRSSPAALGGTLVMSDPEESRPLSEAVAKADGNLQILADDTILVSFMSSGAATDQAAGAARCALRLQQLYPLARIALTFGQGVVSREKLIGDAIDECVRLLAQGSPQGIRIHGAMASLLETRFDVASPGSARFLRAERAALDTGRTLLGKPTSYVGRRADLTILNSVYGECVDESQARAVLVTAGAGVGKSRLRLEFLRLIEVRDERPRVWSAHGDALSAGSPLHLIAQIVRAEAGLLEGESPLACQTKLRERVSRSVGTSAAAGLSEFIAAIASVALSSEASAPLRAARGNAQLMGDQMRAAWEQFVQAELEQGPIVIVLEDLHWGDLSSVAYIDALLKLVADRPLFVLALARPEVREIFPKLWSARAVQEIPLRELSKKSSAALVRQVLGTNAPVETVERIVTHAAGNAFYLEELIRAEASGHGGTLPDTVQATIEARLAVLDPEARRLLRAASVFGQRFWRRGVLQLLGDKHPRTPSVVSDRLASLEEAEVIVRHGEGRFSGDDEYAFRHALVRDAAYAMLTEADRQLGHRLAGTFLEQAGELDPHVLAEHFERGADLDRACVAYARAAQKALDGDDLRGADAFAQRAIACGARGEALGELRLVQARAKLDLGDTVAAHAHAAEGFALLPVGSASWYRVVGALSVASSRIGDDSHVSGLRATFPGIAPGPGLIGAYTEAAVLLAYPLAFAGGTEQVAPLAERIEACAPLLTHEPRVRGGVNRWRSYLVLLEGDYSAYLRLVLQSSADYEEAGSRRDCASLSCDIGFALCLLGKYADAEVILVRALDVAERLGAAPIVAALLHNLGHCCGLLGELARARQLSERALALYEEKQDRRMLGAARAFLARILLWMGELDAASSQIAAALADPSCPRCMRGVVLGVSAEMELARGNTGAALASAEEAMAILEQAGLEDLEALVRLMYAEALLASGQQERGKAALASARQALERRAAKIADPELRASFLVNVPENVRTFTLSRALLNEPTRP